MSQILSFLNLELGDVPEQLRLSATAIYIADILNKQEMFWGFVLENPTPASFNAAGGIAVRQFVEIVLTRLGPTTILEKVTPVLLDHNTNWDSFGLRSVNEELIGEPLTVQMKSDLINILNVAAKKFLEGIIKDLLVVTGNVDFSYGYGYPINDLEKDNYGYGYGVTYNSLDYFDLLVMFT